MVRPRIVSTGKGPGSQQRALRALAPAGDSIVANRSTAQDSRANRVASTSAEPPPAADIVGEQRCLVDVDLGDSRTLNSAPR